MTAPIEVRLRAEWITGIGYRYDVLLDGEVILSRSRDPEYDTARVLHARGLRGRFRTIDFKTGRARMILDIEKAAELCVVERPSKGPPRLEAYRSLEQATKTALHGPPVHQGRPTGFGVAQGTGRTLPAAGGETADAPPFFLDSDDLLPSEDRILRQPEAGTVVTEEA